MRSRLAAMLEYKPDLVAMIKSLSAENNQLQGHVLTGFLLMGAT